MITQNFYVCDLDLKYTEMLVGGSEGIHRTKRRTGCLSFVKKSIKSFTSEMKGSEKTSVKNFNR